MDAIARAQDRSKPHTAEMPDASIDIRCLQCGERGLLEVTRLASGTWWVECRAKRPRCGPSAFAPRHPITPEELAGLLEETKGPGDLADAE
jgi:hypothetical protein